MIKKKKEWKPDGYIKSSLRKIWRWSPARRNCLKSKLCIQCGKKASEKTKLYADHIDPVVDTKTGFQSWDIYLDRLFNGKLQSLCESCHKLKSKEEAKIRAEFRKRRKLLDK